MVDHGHQVIVAEVIRVAVPGDRIEAEGWTVVGWDPRGRTHCGTRRFLTPHTDGPVEGLLRTTPVQGWVEVRRVARDLQLADVEDVAVTGPGGLLAHPFALVLVLQADVAVQVQGALAILRVECTVAAALYVDGAQDVAALLAEVVFLAVIWVGEDAHRGADKVLLVADAVAGP